MRLEADQAPTKRPCETLAVSLCWYGEGLGFPGNLLVACTGPTWRTLHIGYGNRPGSPGRIPEQGNLLNLRFVEGGLRDAVAHAA